ncbi:PqqD family protein [Pseudonocardia saturnea]
MRLRTTEISTRTIGNETIVLNLVSSRYFSVTGIGTRLLELLGRDTDADALVDTVLAEYDVDGATARRDVETFLARLRDARLLQ